MTYKVALDFFLFCALYTLLCNGTKVDFAISDLTYVLGLKYDAFRVLSKAGSVSKAYP